MMKLKAGLMGLCLSCVISNASAEATQISATLLLWQEQETGIAPYATRMLVTERYVRSDDGQNDGNFMLFDRQSRQIFSVSQSERTVLVIEAGKAPEMADAPKAIKVTLQPDSDAPTIDGRPASQFQLYSGDQECLQATVVPGLMPEIVSALREMQAVLASRQYRDLDKTPENYRTPCFLANYIYAIDRHLEAGFPILELRQDGRQRVLLDYRSDQQFASDLFEVPVGYTEQSMP